MKPKVKIKLISMLSFVATVLYLALNKSIPLTLKDMAGLGIVLLLTSFGVVYFALSKFVDSNFDEHGQYKSDK